MNYRLLNEGEMIKEDDFAYHGDIGGWRPTQIAGEIWTPNFIPHRRPVQEPKWEKVSGGGMTYPCWGYDTIKTVVLINHPVAWQHYTHWMPATIPQPPPPEISEEEAAWIDYAKTFVGASQHASWACSPFPKDAFLAGIKWARGQK